jgi:hypothetical protein
VSRDEIVADLLRAQAAISSAKAALPMVENPAGEAADILRAVNGDAGDPQLTEAYAALATARVSLAQAFNSFQRAWDVIDQATPKR